MNRLRPFRDIAPLRPAFPDHSRVRHVPAGARQASAGARQASAGARQEPARDRGAIRAFVWTIRPGFAEKMTSPSPLRLGYADYNLFDNPDAKDVLLGYGTPGETAEFPFETIPGGNRRFCFHAT